MSGHSKWATIKHKKGAADKARGKLWAKLIRQVEVAARAGGGDLDANPTLPAASAEYLATSRLYVDADGNVGHQTLQRWTDYPRFLYEKGLLVGPDGKPLAAPPDYGALFTNDFLP